MSQPTGNLAKAGKERARLLAKTEEATNRLRGLVRQAAAEGRSEASMAAEAGVTRMTIRAWLGK